MHRFGSTGILALACTCKMYAAGLRGEVLRATALVPITRSWVDSWDGRWHSAYDWSSAEVGALTSAEVGVLTSAERMHGALTSAEVGTSAERVHSLFVRESQSRSALHAHMIVGRPCELFLSKLYVIKHAKPEML